LNKNYKANAYDIFPCEVLIYEFIQSDVAVGGNEDTRKHRLGVGQKRFYFLSSNYLKWCWWMVQDVRLIWG